MVWDMQRGLDYLASRPEVNPSSLGCIGHSLGGQQALFLAALDERVRAAVSSCGFASMKTVLRDGINHNFGAYVPGGSRTAMSATSWPRWRRARSWPSTALPIASSPSTGSTIRTPWRGRPTPPPAGAERLDLGIYPGGHGFTDEMRSRAYAWLDRWLLG